MPEQIETTYADLRPTDLVIDKAGTAWPIGDLGSTAPGPVPFWLLDPVTKVKMHRMVKESTDPVTVSRVPSHADEAAKLEAEFPDFRVQLSDGEGYSMIETPKGMVPIILDGPNSMREVLTSVAVSMDQAVAAVEEIGGTVEAEVTAEEVDAANAATEDAPITLPPFADMTPLERRSHLYLLHGVHATDVRSNDELVDMHQQAHAGAVVSKTVPHVHA